MSVWGSLCVHSSQRVEIECSLASVSYRGMIMQKFVELLIETVLSGAALEKRPSSFTGVAIADNDMIESNAATRTLENMIAYREVED